MGTAPCGQTTPWKVRNALARVGCREAKVTPITRYDTFDVLVVEMAHFPIKRSKSDFRTFIQAEAGRPQILSLIHTSDFCRLQGIQEDNSLTALPDSRFNHDRLLYFFYGRPSYRVNPAVSNTRVSSFAPISFVFKKDFTWNGARLHPFDTGAFTDKRMITTIHSEFGLVDFELTATPENAQAIVSAFYDGNKNYIDCNPTNKLDVEDLIKKRQLQVETYYDLLRSAPNEQGDERLHSIQVQFNNDVPLKGNLLAVVIPGRFFDDEQQRSIADEWECKVVPYHLQSVFTPKDLMSLLFDKVRQVLLEDDQLS